MHNNRFAFVDKGYNAYEHSMEYLTGYDAKIKSRISEHFNQCILNQGMNVIDFDQDTRSII